MSAGAASGEDRRIRALRPSRTEVDPWSLPDFVLERERSISGRISSALTIFLIGRECPFTCIFCDLWRHTTDGPTPAEALPGQILAALASVGADRPEVVKLYNASNFFDPRAVPDDDILAIVAAVAGFRRLTVESHPRLVGGRCEHLGELLDGELEVAMGLETVHPEVLPRLNKQMGLEDFERAAERLAAWGISSRAFVLVGVPYLRSEEQVEWAIRAVEHASGCGVGRVSLIPMRGGNGEMERLESAGDWEAPSLRQLEDALEGALSIPGIVVTADTWDLERLAPCEVCRPHRLARLEEANLTGSMAPRVVCEACDGS